MIDGGDGFAAETLAVEVDVLPLDVGDGEDLHLGQEVKRHVVDGFAKNRFLHDENVAAGLFHLLHQIEDVGSARGNGRF